MNYVRTICVILLMLSFSINCLSRDNEGKINIQNVGHHGNHSEYYQPVDMPEVYFDADNLEIVIVAEGYADYYDVEIVSQSSMLAVISTRVDGYGDTIDVSSLPDDDYTIIITSSNHNVYQGTFTNY